MTKKTYISKLKEFLAQYPAEVEQDVLEAFEDHFEAGLDNGLTEAQILRDLGSIREIKENIIDTYGEPPHDDGFDALEKNIKHIGNKLVDVFATIDDAISNSSLSQLDDTIIKDDSFRNIDEECSSLRILCDKLNVNAKIQKDDTFAYSFNGSVNGETNSTAQLFVNVIDEEAQFETISTKKFTSDKNIYELQITIPDSIHKIVIRTMSGDIILNGLDNESIDASSTSGDISFSKCGIYSSTANTASGNISSYGGSGELKYETASGDILIREFIRGAIYASSASGDIRVETYDDIPTSIIKTSSGDVSYSVNNHNFAGEVKTITGNLHASLNTAIYKKKSKGNYIFSTGEGLLQIHTATGDIDLIENNTLF